MSTADTRWLGVIGWPVAHSLSPAMHGAAIAARGLDARYLAFAVRPEALGAAVEGLRALGALGANVTLPHKVAVMAHLDEVEETARAVGAVNTIVREGARLVGVNTDAPGLVRSLEERSVALSGQRALVLGAGGAARAAVVGLKRAGVRSITVAARRLDRAQALRAIGADDAIALDALEPVMRATDLLVQASSATLGTGPTPEAFARALPLQALPEAAVVVDLVYAPRETAVLAAAARRGLVTVDGLGMLLFQAAIAFERWFQVEAPIDAMRDAIAAREGT